MPENQRPTVNCDCPFWGTLFLGLALGVGATVVTEEFILPSTDELDRRDREREARRQEAARLALRSNGGRQNAWQRLCNSGW